MFCFVVLHYPCGGLPAAASNTEKSYTMGKRDIRTKQYMQRPEVFADFFNGLIVNGEDKIDWTTLKELDSTMLANLPDASGQDATMVQKFRDILKNAVIMRNDTALFAVLGIENQSDVHYAMPVRNMLYDALAYNSQVTQRAKRGKRGSGAFLSGIGKGETITPVITVTLYWGSEPWDGPVTLKEMLAEIPSGMLPLINDYDINLFSIIDRDEFPEYKTELGLLFSLLNSRNSDEKLQDLVQSNEAFQHISRETAELMRDYASLRLPRKSKEGDYNMCKAVQEIERKSKEEGRLEGRLEGIEENKVESIRMVMQNFKVTAEQAMEGLGIPKNEYKKYLTML